MGRTLDDLLGQVEAATDHPPVTVQGILHALGERSFSPAILVVGLLMVSPLSGIPGAPTVSALLILTIGSQALMGRRSLWLPGFLLRREVPHERLRRAMGWLRRPARWLDRHSHSRWPVLTTRPMRILALCVCMAIALVWPVLEILPFVTSFGAGAVSLLSFGLLTRDGLYMLLGYGVIAALGATALALIDLG